MAIPKEPVKSKIRLNSIRNLSCCIFLKMVNMKTCSALVVLSLFIFFTVSFAGGIEPASQTPLAISISDPKAKTILNYLKKK